MPHIDIYTIDYCPFCEAAKSLLQTKGAEYTEHNLTQLSDQELRETLDKLAGRTTAPQIFIQDRPIGGYSDLDALDKSGELDRLLKED